MFVAKDFGDFWRLSARATTRTKPFSTKIGTIPKNMNMATNVEPKRTVKTEARYRDRVEKPENRVDKLTDSNVSDPVASCHAVCALDFHARFSTISSFSFNRLSSKLVGMFFGIATMFV